MTSSKHTVFPYGVCFFFLIMTSKADINTFFPQIKGNLTQVIWAHAVNNKTYLDEVLKDDNIMMIEADVIIGKLNDQGESIPILAHPPTTTSDLSLQILLDELDDFNKGKDIKNGKGKGLKLDFKVDDAVKSSNEIIKKQYTDKQPYPLWMNADIIEGPNKPDTKPLNAEDFLNEAKTNTNSLVSIGWTTNVNPKNLSYTDDLIKNMLDVIKKCQVTNELTFAVRANLTANSGEQMKELLTQPNSTLTIWSSQGDEVDVEKLRDIIFEIGVSSIFIDVPQGLRDKLRLDNPPQPDSGVTFMSCFNLLMSVLFIVICM